MNANISHEALRRPRAGSLLAGVVLLAFVAGLVLAVCCREELITILGGPASSGTPVLVRLSDSLAQVNTVDLIPPQGAGLELLLGNPDRSDIGSALPATLAVQREGVDMLRLCVTAEAVQECNWLRRYGLRGLILTYRTKDSPKGNPLDDCLKPGQRYQVALVFAADPPPNSSLWLSYLSPE
jgi:hypothetical protein